MNMIDWLRSRNWSNIVLWSIYLALLGVLLPHTAWAFAQFEPVQWTWLGWIAAIAFEGAIAAFTWKLKQNIERTPRHKSHWLRFRRRYLNIYSLGLLVAIGVSSLANWAHSVEFGQTFAVFGTYSIHPLAYTIAFGAILPACSLLFARILADIQDNEAEVNTDLLEARQTIRELRTELTTTRQQLTRTEDAARFMLELQAEDKARRILAAAHQWPQLSQAILAQIVNVSPGYVSQVLKSSDEEAES